MMFTSHFETSINRTARALTELISDLRRTVRYLAFDIEVEETRAGLFDVQSPEYPVLARGLRARRDNLLATIAILETAKRLHAGADVRS
jgi:hypothetical protein